MSKQEMYDKKQEGLTLEQKRAFDNYFIGALSVLCNDKIWQEALKTADHCARG